MFRKHLRVRRMILGLAFASMVVPVAPAGAVSLSTFVDNGRVAPKSDSGIVLSAPPAYLRYHEVGGPIGASVQTRSEHSSVAPAMSNELTRFLAMAQATRYQQPSAAISERSNGVQGPDPSLVPQVVLSTSNGFDWSDAGIGASTVFAAALLLGIALFITRRNQHSTLTSA
jgi:hypothetical protein